MIQEMNFTHLLLFLPVTQLPPGYLYFVYSLGVGCILKFWSCRMDFIKCVTTLHT